jgi:hypothetical protein
LGWNSHFAIHILITCQFKYATLSIITLLLLLPPPPLCCCRRRSAAAAAAAAAAVACTHRIPSRRKESLCLITLT